MLCTVCGGGNTRFELERHAVLYCDLGCDNKFLFSANFVVFESHKNADALSWCPGNWNLPLCKQYGPLLEPTDENETAGIGTEVTTSVSKVVSMKDLRGGSKKDMELKLVIGWIEGSGMTNVSPGVWVHDPGGDFGITKDDWH